MPRANKFLCSEVPKLYGSLGGSKRDSMRAFRGTSKETQLAMMILKLSKHPNVFSERAEGLDMYTIRTSKDEGVSVRPAHRRRRAAEESVVWNALEGDRHARFA